MHMVTAVNGEGENGEFCDLSFTKIEKTTVLVAGGDKPQGDNARTAAGPVASSISVTDTLGGNIPPR